MIHQLHNVASMGEAVIVRWTFLFFFFFDCVNFVKLTTWYYAIIRRHMLLANMHSLIVPMLITINYTSWWNSKHLCKSHGIIPLISHSTMMKEHNTSFTFQSYCLTGAIFQIIIKMVYFIIYYRTSNLIRILNYWCYSRDLSAIRYHINAKNSYFFISLRLPMDIYSYF